MGNSEGTERTDAQEEIMSATYEALCEHGYAALTVERIASELGKSTAAIHYHYETKDELLVAFAGIETPLLAVSIVTIAWQWWILRGGITERQHVSTVAAGTVAGVVAVVALLIAA